MGSSSGFDPLSQVTRMFSGSDGGITNGNLNAFASAAEQTKVKSDQVATQAAIAENDRKTLLQKDRDQARITQKANALKNQGMAGTILTSPLGVVSGSASNNTLLGS